MGNSVAFNMKVVFERSIWPSCSHPSNTTSCFYSVISWRKIMRQWAMWNGVTCLMWTRDCRFPHVHVSGACVQMFLLKCDLPLKSGCVSLKVTSNVRYWNKKKALINNEAKHNNMQVKKKRAAKYASLWVLSKCHIPSRMAKDMRQECCCSLCNCYSWLLAGVVVVWFGCFHKAIYPSLSPWRRKTDGLLAVFCSKPGVQQGLSHTYTPRQRKPFYQVL